MSRAVEQLMYTIGMRDDNATKTANAVYQSIDNIYTRVQKGQVQIASGGFGLFAAGSMLEGLIDPSRELSAALGEVASLGVDNSALNAVAQMALMTSIEYGDTASAIVGASYDIQSAISGLTGDELAQFTKASAVLAKGTKSDVAEITNYMGTMYGIFKNQAVEMGKSHWVDVLAGQTASAVQMFKTTGSSMSEAFVNLGATGQALDIPLAEQMAVLGQLQAVMPGARAGTAYTAFLNNVAKAQKNLGLSFSDAQGHLLPMVDILAIVQKQFPDLANVDDGGILNKAFGKNGLKVLQALATDTQGLADNVAKLNAVTGMETAAAMASTIADPYERMGAAWTALKIVLGQGIEPVLIPILSMLTRGGQMMLSFSNTFPVLGSVIGIATFSVLGLWAGFSAVTVAMGLYQFAAAGAVSTMLLLKGAMLLASKATLVFNLALWASPITWIVGGIAAIAAGAYFLATNVDWVTQKWHQFRALAEDNFLLNALLKPMFMAVDAVSWVITAFDKIPQWWQGFKHWLNHFDPFVFFKRHVNSLLNMLSAIPGVDITGHVSAEDELKKMRGISGHASSDILANVPEGGVSNHTTHNTGRTLHIENLNVDSQGPINGFTLFDELTAAAG